MTLQFIKSVYKCSPAIMYSTMSQFFSIIALMILAAGGLDIYAQTECNAHGWTGYLSGGLLLGSMIPNMVWVWSRRPSGGREQRFGEDTAMIVKGSLFIWIAMFMAGLFFSGVRAGECNQDMYGWISMALIVLSTASAHMVSKSKKSDSDV